MHRSRHENFTYHSAEQDGKTNKIDKSSSPMMLRKSQTSIILTNKGFWQNRRPNYDSSVQKVKRLRQVLQKLNLPQIRKAKDAHLGQCRCHTYLQHGISQLSKKTTTNFLISPPLEITVTAAAERSEQCPL